MALTPPLASPQVKATVDPGAFRLAMRHVGSAVAIVSTGNNGNQTGFTATSMTCLSIEPPALLVSLNTASSSWPPLREHAAFCVNLLAAEQTAIANRFAGRGGEKGVQRYEGASWQRLSTGALALSGALASIDCALEEAIERHTHMILIGRVKALKFNNASMPLVYWHGSYRRMETLPNNGEA